MGYTRYWYRTEKPITQEFVDKTKEIIKECGEKGITICDWDGKGKPEVTLERISLNGLSPYLDHETFLIDNERMDFDFCKTAAKPYDYAVKKILKVAEEMGIVKDVSSDGEAEECTDAEYMGYREEMKAKYPWFR